jgi:hypothetical protein
LRFGFRRWWTNLRGSITRRWWTNLRGSITRRWWTNLRGSITRRWWTNLRGSITTNPVHYGGGLLDVLKGNIVEVLDPMLGTYSVARIER